MMRKTSLVLLSAAAGAAASGAAGAGGREQPTAALARPSSRERLRVVTRSGSPTSLAALELVSLDRSKAVIVLAPETGPDGALLAGHEADTVVLKVLMAVTKLAAGRALHIVAELSDEPPLRPAPPKNATGLPFRYFFAGRDGARGYTSLARAEEESADTDLEQGFGVAVVGEREGRGGERFGLTRSGFLIPLKDLVAARTSGLDRAPAPRGLARRLPSRVPHALSNAPFCRAGARLPRRHRAAAGR